MKRLSALQFVALGIIWGSSYPLIKVSGEGLNPGQLVLARLVLGSVVLVAIGLATGVRLPPFGFVWVHITITTVLGMVAPFLLLAWGEQHTSAAMAGVLTGATPLLTLALATVQLRSERATTRRSAGLALGFAGIVLVIAPWKGATGTVGGELACLAVAGIYAAHAVFVRKFLSDRGIPPTASAGAQTLVAMVIQAALLPFLGWRTPSFTWSVSVSIVLLGVFGTGLAYVLYNRLIADIGAVGASAVNYLVPFISLLISAVFLGETINWNVPIGGVLIVVSILLGENQLRTARLRWRRGPAVPGPEPVLATATTAATALGTVGIAEAGPAGEAGRAP
ncbi:DMT family transporter [Streptomyces sp. NBC_01136]|uniref:DMT family transporter n=1 Tax=unclassified Streptomyces TaxID=2593676 RepID=UPI00324E9217|nr:DMT family transporter [Streptomyces sp. NBC_01136]WST81165.1 DMT family transporter [Streptomyces sp. NBC_01136]